MQIEEIKLTNLNKYIICTHMNHINKMYAQREPYVDYKTNDGENITLCIDCSYKAKNYEKCGYISKIGQCLCKSHDAIIGDVNYNQHVNTIVFKLNDGQWSCHKCLENII